MDDDVQKHGRPRASIGKLRFSMRSLFIVLVVCSVLFAVLAFHLGRLQRQRAAADYFRRNNSTPIAGTIEFNSFTFDDKSIEDSATPKSGTVSILLPVIKPQKNSVLVEALRGEWFVRRERIVRIGIGAPLQDATLKSNISKMPWLEQIVVECKLNPSANGNKFDCSLSDVQIEDLRVSFPDLKITKTGWINP